LILEQLVKVLEKMDSRLDAVEENMRAMSNKVKGIAGAVAAPTGQLVLRGTLKTKPDEIANAFKQADGYEMEVLEMDVEFSEAIYMGVVPENREEIRKLLAPQQIAYLKRVLEQHKKLSELAEWSETFMKDTADKFDEKQDKLASIIENRILGQCPTIHALQGERKKMQQQAGRIDLAIHKLEEAMVANQTEMLKIKRENSTHNISRESNGTVRTIYSL
jgi:DNA polymerase III delta prime subunit